MGVHMYAENVVDYMGFISCCLDSEMADAVSDCESPIEQLMSLGLMNAIKSFHSRFGTKNAQVEYAKQESIEAKGQTYRVDFMLKGAWTTDNGIVTRDLIVECDGHAYHSTQDQIKRDNRRNRDLMAAGYTVTHFSGSEINQNPYECAVYAIKLLMKDFIEAKNTEGVNGNASEGE